MTYSLKEISENDVLYLREKGYHGEIVGNDIETGRYLTDIQFEYLVKRYPDIETDKNACIEFNDGQIIPLENFN